MKKIILFFLITILTLIIGYFFNIKNSLDKYHYLFSEHQNIIINSVLATPLIKEIDDLSLYILKIAQASGLNLQEIEILKNNSDEPRQLKLTFLGNFKQLTDWLFALYSHVPIKMDNLNLLVVNHRYCKMTLLLSYVNYTYKSPLILKELLKFDPFMGNQNRAVKGLQDDLVEVSEHKITMKDEQKGLFCVDKSCWIFLQLLNGEMVTQKNF